MARKILPKQVKESVDEFINALENKKLPISSVYVFGSFVRGHERQWSDIDVCVVSSKFNDPWSAMRYLWRNRPPLKDPYAPAVEPVGFSNKDFREGGDLIDEIKKTGVRIR